MKRKIETRNQELKKEKKNYSPSSSNMDRDRYHETGISFLKSSSQTKHDGNKRKDADVTKRGSGPAVPNAQWEQIVNITPAGIPNDPAGAFLPMSGTVRPVPHKKINECDY